MIRITLLGTGAMKPSGNRFLASVLLNCCGETILFDCGEATQLAAAAAGVSLIKITAVALTHYHGDHIFGLPGLLQTINSTGRTKPLYILGPGGISKYIKPLVELAGKTEFDVICRELSNDEIVLSDLSGSKNSNAVLTVFKTHHRVESIGYCFVVNRGKKFLPEKAKKANIPIEFWNKLQHGNSVVVGGTVIESETVMGEERRGIKIVISGDTAYCDRLVEYSENADILICDGTYGENTQIDLARQYGHMTFAQAAQTACRAGVKRLCLTHYSQMIDNPEDYLTNASVFFKNTFCGTDGMNIDLSFEK